MPGTKEIMNVHAHCYCYSLVQGQRRQSEMSKRGSLAGKKVCLPDAHGDLGSESLIYQLLKCDLGKFFNLPQPWFPLLQNKKIE